MMKHLQLKKKKKKESARDLRSSPSSFLFISLLFSKHFQPHPSDCVHPFTNPKKKKKKKTPTSKPPIHCQEIEKGGVRVTNISKRLM
jgi:hypothetical protein